MFSTTYANSFPNISKTGLLFSCISLSFLDFILVLVVARDIFLNICSRYLIFLHFIVFISVFSGFAPHKHFFIGYVFSSWDYTSTDFNFRKLSIYWFINFNLLWCADFINHTSCQDIIDAGNLVIIIELEYIESIEEQQWHI